MKSFITIQEAAAVVLLGMPNRTASFEEIAAAIEKRGLFAGRKSSTSLAKEIELKTTVDTGKYKHWFGLTKSGSLALKDIS